MYYHILVHYCDNHTTYCWRLLVLKDSSSGEKFQVAIGRHEQHGSTKNHTIAIIGDQEHLIVPGTLIYASPLEKHQFINNGPDPIRYLVITAPCWIPQDSWK